eukprot:GDKK01003875.1.p1 GENE.GDKK01003875.1~~GDKK01003875.1.p1  ORF type:complete len:431 (-),score=41.66 GDKK01003875.1:229-1521(-)
MGSSIKMTADVFLSVEFSGIPLGVTASGRTSDDGYLVLEFTRDVACSNSDVLKFKELSITIDGQAITSVFSELDTRDLNTEAYLITVGTTDGLESYLSDMKTIEAVSDLKGPLTASATIACYTDNTISLDPKEFTVSLSGYIPDFDWKEGAVAFQTLHKFFPLDYTAPNVIGRVDKRHKMMIEKLNPSSPCSDPDESFVINMVGNGNSYSVTHPPANDWNVRYSRVTHIPIDFNWGVAINNLQLSMEGSPGTSSCVVDDKYKFEPFAGLVGWLSDAFPSERFDATYSFVTATNSGSMLAYLSKESNTFYILHSIRWGAPSATGTPPVISWELIVDGQVQNTSTSGHDLSEFDYLVHAVNMDGLTRNLSIPFRSVIKRDNDFQSSSEGEFDFLSRYHLPVIEVANASVIEKSSTALLLVALPVVGIALKRL